MIYANVAKHHDFDGLGSLWAATQTGHPKLLEVQD
jgi:hypothetical protein